MPRRGVRWYSRLITGGLLGALCLFGVYAWQQYGEALTPPAAIVYTRAEPLFPPLETVATSEMPVAKTDTKKKTAASAPSSDSKSSAPTSAATTTSAVSTTTTPALPPVTPVPIPVVIPASTTTPPPVTPPPPPVTIPPPPPPPAATTTPPATGEIRFTAYTTGYGWPDNTPPGSDISDPVLHQVAGGTGTYGDPITVAVGHTISLGKDTLDYPKGTKFYIPNLRRYFIVEDTCGDGNTPQNGPCHTGYQGHAWLDVWVGGVGASSSSVLSCEDTITDLHLVIQNPASSYAVTQGPVFGTSCSAQFGESVVSS